MNVDQLGQKIDEELNGPDVVRPSGFVLVVFPTVGIDGRSKSANFSTNLVRESLVDVLRQFANQLERQEDEVAGHG